MAESSMERLSVGTRVVDTEDEEPDVAIVVLRPEKTIEDWEFPTKDGKLTVTETNSEYPADSPVVVVVFRSELEEEWPAWDTAEPDTLFDGVREHGVYCYGFPETRLKLVRDETREGDNLDDVTTATDQINPDPPDVLLELGERLEANGATVTTDRGGIVVEKLGEAYRITPGGKVEGDGALAESLAHLRRSTSLTPLMMVIHDRMPEDERVSKLSTCGSRRLTPSRPRCR